jgi:hypothetical protein
MTLDPYALKIYIDGSALKNPGGASGCAGIAEYPSDWNRPEETLFTVGYEGSTNNRMELLACVKAMEYVRDHVAGLASQNYCTDHKGTGVAPHPFSIRCNTILASLIESAMVCLRQYATRLVELRYSSGISV